MAEFNDTQFIRLPGMNGYEPQKKMSASLQAPFYSRSAAKYASVTSSVTFCHRA